MNFDKTLIGAFLLVIFALASSACGISISVSNNAGGFTENINAGDGDSVFGSAVIGSDSLSNSIRGSGNLKVSHWVSNTAGTTAGTGADIRKAESYTYDYYLTPGSGFFWPASRHPVVSASETLDVTNAYYINAYASSFNAQGDAVGVSTILLDPERKASLTGYSNKAIASAKLAGAFQNAKSASAPEGSIQTEADSQMNQLRILPLELRMEKADASTTIKFGSIDGYYDLASASNDELDAFQHIDDASGSQINTKSKSTFDLASLFNGLKKSTAEASTMTFGNLTGYDGITRVSKNQVEVLQSGHIEGAFTSTAVAGKACKTRSSNYGHEYDLNMQAKKDASGSSATGMLGYYVDGNDPIANKIQGAVDASESGDAVNVAPGAYYENVQIDKSLTVKGSAAGNDPSTDTIVNGQKNGSVFTIGKSDSEVKVSLQSMTIQNGSGTYMEKWLGLPPVQFGGGIWNNGTLSIVSSLISGNTANGYGSGIWSTGNLTVESSSIEGNGKPLDGGGIWSSGNLVVNNSIITGNGAYWNGGGIWSSGNMILENSYVGENTANLYGGGVANDLGQATVKDSTISANTATVGGGGIYNILGTVSLEDSNVSWNSGNVGGGILNNGEMIIDEGIVSSNYAANGGGVFNMGTMELNGALVDNNTASENGGGIHNNGMIVIMDSNISENIANYAGGGIFCSQSGTASFEGSNIISKNIAHTGGGIYNQGIAVVLGSVVSENTAGFGAGIENFGTAIVADSRVSDNTAAYRGGGISNEWYGTAYIEDSNISENTANNGGGISNSGIATIIGCNLSKNIANLGGGSGFGGGGISNDGIANITSSYISENTAYYGGGVYNNYGGSVTVADSTISKNTADFGGGDIFNNSAWGDGGGVFNQGAFNVTQHYRN